MNARSHNAGLACINTKERKKKERQGKRANKMKGIEPQREKPQTPFQSVIEVIGDEEQNRK